MSEQDETDILADARAYASANLLLANTFEWALQEVEQLGSRAAGEWELRVARTQVTFARRRGFLVLSNPAQMGRRRFSAALSFAINRPVSSKRFAAVAHPAKSMWVHHLWLPAEVGLAELEGDAGAEVRGWIAEAWQDAALR